MICSAQDYLDDCLHLRGPYMLTIRRDAPIYFTREQVSTASRHTLAFDVAVTVTAETQCSVSN